MSAFAWFQERFGNEIASQLKGTPFDISLIAALAVNRIL